MYIAAVQEERQRNKEKGEGEAESTVNANSDMPVEKILEAELAVEPKTDTYIDAQVKTLRLCNIDHERYKASSFCQTVDSLFKFISSCEHKVLMM